MKKNIFIILLFAVQLFSAQNFHIKYVNTISPIANVQEDLYISDNNVVSVRDSIVNFYSNQPGNVKFNESTNNVQISPKSMPHKVLIYKKKDNETFSFHYPFFSFEQNLCYLLVFGFILK